MKWKGGNSAHIRIAGTKVIQRETYACFRKLAQILHHGILGAGNRGFRNLQIDFLGWDMIFPKHVQN